MEILLNRAEAVVAISCATRDAILRNFSLSPDRIQIIPSGMDPIPPSTATNEAKEKRPYALLVTNDLPHKNTVATCRAWARSRGPREGVVLRVVGKIPEAAREACHRIPVLLEHGLSDVELATAYRNCRFLIAPSLSEGHDLPVAEALAHGADVLCSDIDVHREYYDGRVRFFDPLCEDAIVEALDNALWAPRPWFEPPLAPLRSFADVARDYAALFQRIESNNG
jgi:glycosyltransferase involved in cell wall biosynthesis